MQEEKKIQSKFSSGINIIIRLDELWKDTHRHSRSDKFYAWDNDLDCIWRELARDLNEEEFEKWKTKIDDIKNQLKKTGKFQDESPSGFQKPSVEQLKNREKQYDLLDEKQLLLARLENDLGKGTTEKEDEDDWE